MLCSSKVGGTSSTGCHVLTTKWPKRLSVFSNLRARWLLSCWIQLETLCSSSSGRWYRLRRRTDARLAIAATRSVAQEQVAAVAVRAVPRCRASRRLPFDMDEIARSLLPLLDEASTLVNEHDSGCSLCAGRRHGFYKIVLAEPHVRRAMLFFDASALAMASLVSRHWLRATSHPALWAALLRQLGCSGRFARSFTHRPRTAEVTAGLIVALADARKSVHLMDPHELREIAQFRAPPAQVHLLCSAVFALVDNSDYVGGRAKHPTKFNSPRTLRPGHHVDTSRCVDWQLCRAMFRDPAQFLRRLLGLSPRDLPAHRIERAADFVRAAGEPRFEATATNSSSLVRRGLAQYVLAIVHYAQARPTLPRARRGPRARARSA